MYRLALTLHAFDPDSSMAVPLLDPQGFRVLPSLQGKDHKRHYPALLIKCQGQRLKQMLLMICQNEIYKGKV